RPEQTHELGLADLEVDLGQSGDGAAVRGVGFGDLLDADLARGQDLELFVWLPPRAMRRHWWGGEQIGCLGAAVSARRVRDVEPRDDLPRGHWAQVVVST